MRDLRISIVVLMTVLICVGIVMIFSSSGVYALQELGSSYYFLSRHLLFLLMGLILMIAFMAIDYRDLRRFAKPILLIAIFSLILVLVPFIGKEINGARRWFRLGFISIQPSEFTKIAVLIYVADFLSRKHNKIRDFWEGFLPIMLMLGAVCLLILKQPDLGTAVFIAAVVLIVIFVAGARLLHLGLIVLVSLPVIYLLIAKVAYRMHRIMAFLDPWQDSQGVGFQLSQSQIALGSGGLFGLGLGKSMQKLFYLPAAHTDFIFSIIGEELGLVGTLAIIFLFVLLIWQSARIAKRITYSFGYFLSVGIVTMLGLQAVINLGVSIGALPTKGLPLPFISYGGSALMVDMIAVGLLLNISRTQEL